MTTPYYPQSNGLVERLHGQLKAAVHCHGDEWFDAIPVILLGLRSAWKENLQATLAELTYGEPLPLLGKFLAPTVVNSPAPALVKKLRDRLRSLAPVPTSHHGTKPTFFFKDLATCSRVFVRNDQARKAYGSPYSDPFRIVSRHEKYFNVFFRSETGYRNYESASISIDRLKPAYMVPEDLDQILGPSPDGQPQQQRPQQQPQPSTSASAASAPSTSASSSNSQKPSKKVSFNLPNRQGR
ncbi:uncharacterized protein LOC107039113 [Diachasma alloeum]|uniref:uncharacterized protein LOC107039113 n=1 Tax=Diachasma alloeum TaxID=454923 RepID=UPI00073848E1|nr:uncharacterized protein LOC107039113 [Diachasma alloeum]